MREGDYGTGDEAGEKVPSLTLFYSQTARNQRMIGGQADGDQTGWRMNEFDPVFIKNLHNRRHHIFVD